MKSATHEEGAHNLSTITGYIVERTFANKQKFKKAREICRYDGANRYGDALQTAKSYRQLQFDSVEIEIVSWAVVRAIYSDGCISEPF